MTTTQQYDADRSRFAALVEQVIAALGPDLVGNPQLAEVINRTMDDRAAEVAAADASAAMPGDGGLADLIGLGSAAPSDLGASRISPGVIGYDERIAREQLYGVGELYYQCLHEQIGVFTVMRTLQDLFRAGTLRISAGPGAYGLYRFDRRGVLRYQERERMQAYRRVFGYTRADPGPNARANAEFHPLFRHFIGETAKFWRDKRISEVIRNNASDPSFGSIAIVRRSALDLRNNIKNSSYGWVNVMRVESSQALEEAFNVLDAPDVREQFGAQSAWDVIELVLWQYHHRSVNASALNRMAVSGRELIRWLAEPFVLKTNRTDFEALLQRVAEYAEEWISSEEGLRISRPTPPPRNVYMPGAPPVGARNTPVIG